MKTAKLVLVVHLTVQVHPYRIGPHMKERYSSMVGRSNQQLFEICSGQNNTLPEQLYPDKRYLQALKLLLRLQESRGLLEPADESKLDSPKAGSCGLLGRGGSQSGESGAIHPDLRSVKTPDKYSLIAQAVRTANENGGKDFTGLTLEEKARFCTTLATTMSNRSRQEAAARAMQNHGESFFKTIGEKGRKRQAQTRLAPSNPPELTQKRSGFIRRARKKVEAGIRIALAAFAISTTSVIPMDVFAATSYEPDLSEEVPTLHQEDFTKWSNRFPQDTRKSLQDIVTENKEVGFDGRVASEIVFMENQLNSRGFSFSLSPNMVRETYAKYITACGSNPNSFWQEIISGVAQNYVDEVKVVVANFDLQSIKPAQKAENTEVPNAGRKPNPNFAEMTKRPVIIENISDFEQALTLYGYNPDEISDIYKSVKLNPQREFDLKNFSFSRAYTIFDLLREAAKRRIALSETEMIAGLEYVKRDAVNTSSLDAIDRYLSQFSKTF